MSADRPDLHLGDLVRQLRARPWAFWTPDRVSAVQLALQELADLAADRAAGPRRSVPDLDPTAFGDQLAVLMAAATRAGVDPAVLAVVADRIRRTAAPLGMGL